MDSVSFFCLGGRVGADRRAQGGKRPEPAQVLMKLTMTPNTAYTV